MRKVINFENTKCKGAFVTSMTDHEKVIKELKTGKYNLTMIEALLNIPKNTLYQCISGSRKIPTKYFEGVKIALKI